MIGSVDRVVVSENVYHQTFGEEATRIESRFSRFLKSEEQLYQRHVTVGENWERLDHGWVQTASMLVVKNNTGNTLQVHASKEMEEHLDSCVVEIGAGLDSAVVPVIAVPRGESARFTPVDTNNLFVRCRNGKAKVVLSVVPS